MRRTLAALTAAAIASTGAATAYAAHAQHPRLMCTGDPSVAHALTVRVAGENASGYYAVPKHRARGLVVFDHGYSHTAWNWRQHLTQVAARDGVIAIAMDYRHQQDSPVDPKTGLSSSRGWRVQEGADDSIAAAKLFDATCRTGGVNTVYGISMGGNTSGLVAAEAAKRASGKPLFNYWFAIEPAVNVTETWAEASAVAQSGNTFAVDATQDIEQEMGGTPADVPASYQSHTVMARMADIAAAGLSGVAVVQGVDDGLVPYNQSRELVTALRAAGIPVDDVTVGTRGSGEAGTTLSGNALGPLGQESPFAGHASEVSNTQVVGLTGFALLDQLYVHHQAPACRESFRDGDTGQWQISPATC
ncbi:MAG TPA: alpha/beta fold hydrolase [Mycobacteriales bacterium]|nr:alpha/beta fold hydrolase [Mycobacteriales bacterium]